MSRKFLLGFITILLLAVAVPAPAQFAGRPNMLSFEEGEEGWLLAFYGKDLDNWVPRGEANWTVVDGEIRVSDGERSLLMTDEDYPDFELKVDFLADRGANSGVFFRVNAEGGGELYELNIAPPDHRFPTGSLLRVNLEGAEPSFGIAEVYKDAGELDDWRTFHLIVEGGFIEVRLDGQKILEVDDPDPLETGRIALQHNQGAIAFRNVKVRRLSW
ncbi:MAG: DUF1080 domain-containing protein [Acidobacteriota bacterium]|nr:DUF1080 domain-containing protein [Acidobacteriota bacterium]